MALARALAKRPKVLLLDEPLGALDKKLREETQFELIDLQEKLGLTFVIVTHDQEEAMTVADRIAVMDHGKIVQIATPAEIYEAPNSRYVADFIGYVNIFEGTVAEVAPERDRACERRTACRPGRERRGGRKGSSGLVRGPARRRCASRHEAPRRQRRQRGRGRGLGHRLFRRHDDLQRAAPLRDKWCARRLMNAAAHVERPITWDDKVWLSWAPDAGVVPGEVGARQWPSARNPPAAPGGHLDPLSLAAASSSSRPSSSC